MGTARNNRNKIQNTKYKIQNTISPILWLPRTGAIIDDKPILPHGLHGIFISNSAHIGKNVVIFHQVTIGSNMTVGGNNGGPTIGDNAYIGCGAKIIGNLVVGNNARIGANCIVVKDVPANSVAVTTGTVIIVKEQPLNNTFIANNADYS